MVIFQSPTWNSTEFDAAYLAKLKSYHGLKLVIFVHDVIPLMFATNEYLMDKLMAAYNMADLIILPSQAMLDELRKRGLTVEKVLFQEMWDHPTDLELPVPPFSKELHFAGNPSRFQFVQEWTFPNKLLVYSREEIDNPALNVDVLGWHTDLELLQQLAKKGGFGLVWSEPGGVEGKYYELNVSYKLSTYLAAGLPVIVQNTLSNHALIEKNGLGIVVDDLETANEKLASLTEEDYKAMVAKVQEFRKLIVNGYFTRKLLTDSVFQLFQQG